MARGKVVVCVALVLAVATSLIVTHPGFQPAWKKLPMMGCLSSAENSAYRADSQLLSWLSNAPRLVHLTDGKETASEVLEKLDSYRALVVVTAGRGGPNRRAPDQPFASVSPDAAPLLGPLLSAPLSAMNAAAGALESVTGRPLFPLSLGTFERSSTKAPYAIFDASSGSLLLDRQLVSYTWGGAGAARGAPEADHGAQVSYLTLDLAGRVFRNVADMLGARKAGEGMMSNNGSGGMGGGPAEVEAEELQKLRKEEEEAVLQQDQRRQLLAASSLDLQQDMNIDTTTTTTTHNSNIRMDGPAAAAAVSLVAAALAAALPAAFAAAPPLWFCILCPSVLGLLAPVLINTALNQLAGALCRQMQLSDDACFDVLLGALGAGFVLSLASAVPIFFACRLPQCAGRNVTAGLARVMMRG